MEPITASFVSPVHKDVDAAWAQEVEERLDAYDRGRMSAAPVSEVFKDIELI